MLSGVASKDSEFYLRDEEDERPRVRFRIINEWVSPPIEMDIYALVDSGAECELILPQSACTLLQLKPTGAKRSSKGSTNTTAKKLMFKPVNLKAMFFRDDVQEERSVYLDVSAFLEPLVDEKLGSNVGVPAASGISSSLKRSRRDSDSSSEEKGSKIIASAPLVSLVEHRPRSAPDQRVILGARALRKLSFHVNVAGRCLEIEEERVVED